MCGYCDQRTLFIHPHCCLPQAVSSYTNTLWCLFAACSCQTTNQSGEGEQGERGARRPGEEKKHFIPSIMNLSNYCEGVRVSVCVKSNWHLKKKKTTFWLTAASCCSETHICPWNITMHKCVCVCVLNIRPHKSNLVAQCAWPILW